jgi:hypothetical protein
LCLPSKKIKFKIFTFLINLLQLIVQREQRHQMMRLSNRFMVMLFLCDGVVNICCGSCKWLQHSLRRGGIGLYPHLGYIARLFSLRGKASRLSA